MAVYYNEIDPYAAQWLRNLIAGGHIAPGDVDERSIVDVRPSDLDGYTQCHFFAGIGVWSHALRMASWGDHRPVWTASCPCQPFSAAGKGAGFDDERHLWPHLYWLISQCRPVMVVGEQVASKDGLAWFDLVQSDLEGTDYAVGALDLCAAGFGAPHIRQRLYWLAHADSAGLQQGREGRTPMGHGAAAEPDSGVGFMADADGGHAGAEWQQCGWKQRQQPQDDGFGHNEPAGPTNGQWRDADWLLCRDGKWRPVEPGTFPLARGAPARVGRLRAYGNAIVAPQAVAFIQAVMG